MTSRWSQVSLKLASAMPPRSRKACAVIGVVTGLLLAPRFALSTDLLSLIEAGQLRATGQSTDLTCSKEDPDGKLASLRRRCQERLCPQGVGQLQALMDAAYTRVAERPYHPGDKEFLGSLKQKIDSEIQAQLARMQELRKVLSSDARPESPQGRALLALTATITQIGRSVVLRPIAGGNGDQLEVDREATRARLPAHQRQHLDTLTAVYSRFLRQREADELRPGPLEEYTGDRFQHYQQRYTPDERARHGREALALFERLSEHSSRFAPPGADASDIALLSDEVRERLRTGSFTEADTDKLKSELFGLRLGHAIGSDASLMRAFEEGLGLRYRDLLPTSRAAETTEPDERLLRTLDQRIREFSDYIKSPEAPGPVRSQVLRTLGRCGFGLDLARELLPKTDPTARVRQMVRSAAARVSSSLARYVSGHSRRAIDSSLADIKVASPRTVDQHLRDMSERLGGETKPNWQERSSPELKLIFASGEASAGDWSAVSEHLQELCRRTVPEPVPDSAIVGGDQIVVGPIALHDRRLGEGICAHELGHHISGLFAYGRTSAPSKTWYESVRSCLRRPTSNDRQVEEDWADFVSNLSGYRTSPTWCAFASPETFGRPRPYEAGPQAHSRDELRAMHNRMVFAGETIPECEALFLFEVEGPPLEGANVNHKAGPVMRDCREPQAAAR